MAYSSDGRTWTAVTSSFGSSHIQSIAFSGGRFVAVGASGKAAYSTDGRTWTAVTTSVFGTSNNAIRAVAYGNGRFVAVGQGGRMAYCDW